MEDVSYLYIRALQDMSKNLQAYFDYEASGRDMEINGSFYEDEESILWKFI